VFVYQAAVTKPDCNSCALLWLQRHFLTGGPQRMRHTLPPLAFSALSTLRQVAAAEKDGATPRVGSTEWYRFLHRTASELAAVPAAELALQLFLTCAHSASGELGAGWAGSLEVRWCFLSCGDRSVDG
jgi:vacuolar protein sorting-associated protein 35